jgi:hypothetical protein
VAKDFEEFPAVGDQQEKTTPMHPVQSSGARSMTNTLNQVITACSVRREMPDRAPEADSTGFFCRPAARRRTGVYAKFLGQVL